MHDERGVLALRRFTNYERFPRKARRLKGDFAIAGSSKAAAD